MSRRTITRQILTGLLYVNASAEDLHEHLHTVATPLNGLNAAELCRGRRCWRRSTPNSPD